ncbi:MULTISPECIES: beta galactosidase jelly roll domain-containing protein [Burkholderia]|uniref:beta galactosidase jelly roll domain-containing protein n=1 Tax=Burkholderia TaxID=32008 RepID=UPI000551D77B|nr:MULTISPECIES: beta galactosidase jelly roll domain-containing protein [Burkholderia]AOJ13169.1 hypothetical protein WJ02_06000 [Burkholderia vietnamiensis]TCT31931.1 beta-galactosidase-like protein [Burkholderia vietnamiensis]SCZ28227.1 hypothetical protein SAMN02787148_106278 [Burkholderia vietnamiensis]SFX63663.1 hypothetical protein SAMN02787160_106279 [Burkholderia vietnamiensis]HDR9256390.1 beta galactosidase jelly roll domain-containing protein [Burkholderia vietnamiensis]
MSKLSKDEIQRIDTELSFPFGCVVLRCDGNTITIQVQRTKPRRYDLMVYVNGWFKGEYLKEAAPEHRFYRPVKISAYKPTERAKIEKNFGKRKARKYFPNLDHTSTFYMPSWNTTSTMLRHFARVCQSVTLVSVGVAVNTSVDLTAQEAANV